MLDNKAFYTKTIQVMVVTDLAPESIKANPICGETFQITGSAAAPDISRANVAQRRFRSTGGAFVASSSRPLSMPP